MDLPTNTFKQRLTSGEAQIGLWVGLANPYCAELAANAGFDWLLLDGEHAPRAEGRRGRGSLPRSRRRTGRC